MCATIFTMILVFALKYRRRRGIQAEQIEGSTALEVTWSVWNFPGDFCSWCDHLDSGAHLSGPRE
jgi:hypothetical protein